MVIKFVFYTGLAAMAAAISCATPACVEQPVPTGPAVTYLTPQNFDEALANAELPVVVDFYADWCGPCGQMKPIYEKVCEDMRGEVQCFAFDVDQDRGQPNRVSARYDARYIPSYRYFNDDVEDTTRRVSGARSEDELKSEIEDFIKSCE